MSVLAFVLCRYNGTQTHASIRWVVCRGVAKRDGSKLTLLLEDFPFAEDGLLVWNAIEEYFTEYLNLYYSDSGAHGKPKAGTLPSLRRMVKGRWKE